MRQNGQIAPIKKNTESLLSYVGIRYSSIIDIFAGAMPIIAGKSRDTPMVRLIH